VIVLGAVVALASPAAAQPADDADAKGKALFDEGKRAIEAEDIETACRKFEESYVVSGVPGALLSWADCEERRGRFATALSLWKQGEAKVIGNAERQEYVRNRQLAVVPKVSWLELLLPPDRLEGLAVTLDGRPIDVTKGPVAVDAGEHRVVVEATARKKNESIVRLDIGERKSVTLFSGKDVTEATAPPASPDQPDAPPASGPVDDSDPRLPFFISGGVVGGVGVASLVVFGVTGGLILSTCGNIDLCPASERDTVDGLAIANVVTLGVGIAGVVTGAILLGVGATMDDAAPPPVQVGGFADAGIAVRFGF
jgi:hypothetical protein